MSTPEIHPPSSSSGEHAGGKLGGVKHLLGKKVLGIPVIFLVLAAAAAGLYLYTRNAGASVADTPQGDEPGAGAGGYDPSGLDPGGVSGLSSGGLGGGGGQTSPDSVADLSSQIAGLGDAIASIQFPSGNPDGQNVSSPLSQMDPAPVAAATPKAPAKPAKKAPPKTRGGKAIPVKVHPVVAARPKPKPAAAPKRATPKPAAGKAKIKAAPTRAPSRPTPAPAPKPKAPPKPAPKRTTSSTQARRNR